VTTQPISAIDPELLSRSLEPLGTATMLPAVAYTSPDVLAWERQHFFAGTWSCLGRDEDLRSPRLRPDRPVTQRAVRVGEVGLLLTWAPAADGAGEDEVRAFANTCRHRGHELLPTGDTGDRASVICPYHAWSYDLAGRVRATPRLDGPVDPELGLVEVPVKRWHGWVFVHAATPLAHADPSSFEDHLGALAKIVEPYSPEGLVRLARHSYEVAANWKVITENYHECYHCPLIHPELCQVSPPDSGQNYDLPGAWVGGWMSLRDGMTTMSVTGESAGRPIAGVPAGRIEYLGLFPDLLISLHPDYLMTHRLLPLAPDRTMIECSWYFPGDDIDPTYAVEFWDLTNRQDWGACESVQRGLTSPHFKPGPFAPAEDAVHRFVGLIARAYLGAPVTEPAAVQAQRSDV
jgi:Rieske 2Fe-2S family protein